MVHHLAGDDDVEDRRAREEQPRQYRADHDATRALVLLALMVAA